MLKNEWFMKEINHMLFPNNIIKKCLTKTPSFIHIFFKHPSMVFSTVQRNISDKRQ